MEADAVTTGQIKACGPQDSIYQLRRRTGVWGLCRGGSISLPRALLPTQISCATHLPLQPINVRCYAAHPGGGRLPQPNTARPRRRLQLPAALHPGECRCSRHQHQLPAHLLAHLPGSPLLLPVADQLPSGICSRPGHNAGAHWAGSSCDLSSCQCWASLITTAISSARWPTGNGPLVLWVIGCH